MIKKWCIQNKYSIFVMLLLMCFCGYNIVKSYGFVLFPDEFGYWTYAAMLAGYDWSDIVSLGSYYSYGYSLILFPIFVLCKNAVSAYRVAIAVNFLLLIVCFFLWKRLAGRLFCDRKENKLYFYAAIAVFYPSWLFYARTTLAEIVIVTLYAAICMLLYDYLEHNRMPTLIMLVLALVYIHFVHMRTVAVLVACAITLSVYFIVKKKKVRQSVVFILMLTGMFVGGYFLKEWITGNIYAASEKVSTNDYAGQMGKLAYMFTIEGFKNLVISVAGKVLYLGMASFGLGFWGIWYAVKKLLGAVKEWKAGRELAAGDWFYLFVILATIGTIMVNAIYTIKPGRVDALVYGRYHEYVMPILILLGLRELEKRKRIFEGLAIMLFLEGIMTGLVTWSLHTYGQTNMHAYMMVGMSYLYREGGFEPIHFFWQAYVLGGVLTITVSLVLWWIGRHKNMEIMITCILTLEIMLAVRSGTLFLDESARGAYRDTKIVERVEQLKTEEDRELFYLHDGDYALVSILQFMLREEDIRILREDDLHQEEMGQRELLLIDYRNPLADELQEQYEAFMENGHFVLFYNE